MTRIGVTDGNDPYENRPDRTIYFFTGGPPRTDNG